MKKIILVLFVALFSLAAAEAQQPKGEKKTVTTTFVTDIDCAGCAKKVDNTIPYEKGVKVVYAVSYNTKDKAEVKKVLEELHSVFGGFMASDTEDLEPVFEVAEF